MAIGQAATPKPPQPAAPSPSRTEPTDAALDAAQQWIGRALFLRGSYLANNLNYAASGQAIAPQKSGDWTLSGVDLQKVIRRSPEQIELEGLRVAIRYNPDNHQFERHPQKDATIKILLTDPGSADATETALDAIFSQGIDPRLQHATPDFWQHYFNPALPWPQDVLSAQQIFVPTNPPGKPSDPTQAVVLHKTDAKLTLEAEKDRVQGTLQLRMVIDAQGVPQRIAIVRPLGYGLDERAVEAVAKWRFTPAMQQDQPLPSALLLNYQFAIAPPLRP